MKRGLWLAILFVVALGVIVYRGINGRTATAAAVQRETVRLAVPTVTVIHPKPGALQDEIVLPGNVQAFTDAPIYARASGYLKKWYVDIGAHVKAGQLLAEIDAPEIDQQVQQARAALEQAKAAQEQASANYEQGKSNAEIARVTAQRWSSLVGKGAVSKQENDQYQAQSESMAANLRALEKAIAAARSSVAAAEADLARVTDLQNYKLVKAPFDGVITARNTDVGALINAGNGGLSQELFHLAANSPLRVYIDVPEINSRAAAPGVTAYLTLAEYPDRRFTGKIARFSGAIDAATRTLRTEVDVENTSGALFPGSYAQVHLKLDSATPALIVPVSALIFRSEGLRVGLIRDGKAVLMPVTMGKDFGSEVEIVSGLKPDDRVIENPPDSFVSGMEVRVVQPAKATS
jgi:RND family efflux transporter MFP subunit